MNSFPTGKRISTPSSSAFSLAENHYFVLRPLWVESSPFMAVEAGGASKLSGINAAQAMAFLFRQAAALEADIEMKAAMQSRRFTPFV